MSALHRLNTELSITVIIAEHRLEHIFPAADKVIFMYDSQIAAVGTPDEVCAALYERGMMFAAMPAPARLYALTKGSGKCPLTVKQGRQYVRQRITGAVIEHEIEKKADKSGSDDEKAKIALELKGIWFRYGRNTPDVLKGASLRVKTGTVMCVLGDNASGKTTALGIAAGLYKPYSGTVRVQGCTPGKAAGDAAAALLPQNARDMFTYESVSEEARSITPDIAQSLGIDTQSRRHPYDLSGGERQLLALGKLLCSGKRVILLDEPTKGTDALVKERLCRIITDYKQRGFTFVIVTHDVEFAAKCADVCAMLFDGVITSLAPAREFFSLNSYYTTAASLMTRGMLDGVITVEQAAHIIGGGADL